MKTKESTIPCQNRKAEAYQLQRKQWERQLQGHLAPKRHSLQKERESKRDTDE